MSKYTEGVTKVLVEAIEDSFSSPEALIGKLMSANFRDYSNTTSTLLESYQDQIADLKAEISAIHKGVERLFEDGHMPTESSIIRAVFYPSRSLIESCRESPRETS